MDIREGDRGAAEYGLRRLAQGRQVRLEPRERLFIECLAGRVWIALEGDPREHSLAPGLGFSITAGASVQIGARDGAGLVRVTRRPPAGPSTGPFFVASLHDAMQAARAARSAFLASLCPRMRRSP